MAEEKGLTVIDEAKRKFEHSEADVLELTIYPAFYFVHSGLIKFVYRKFLLF